MSQIAPSTTQIQAHVQRLRRSPRNEGMAVGIRSAGRWSGSETFTLEERPYDIAWCTSPLEVRERLAGHDATTRGLVIVTPLDEHELGADVLARLARQRLETIRAWDILLEQFQAKQIDPQVAAHRWMADTLLSLLPEGGFEAVPAGVLDAQTVWKVLLSRKLLLRQHPVDLESLLAWTRDAQGIGRYAQVEADFRTALRDHLTRTCGSAAAAVLDCIDGGFGPDAVPLGLVCCVVFHESAGGKPAFEAGAVRLEKYTMDHPLSVETARRWASAAEMVLRRIQETEGLNAVRPVLARADQLLTEVKGQSLAHLSDVLPLGFEGRLSQYAQRLSAWLAEPSQAKLEGATAAAEDVLRHDQAEMQQDRVRRVQMSLRLARYLAGRNSIPAGPAPFDELALDYARDGGFVDWARSVLAGEGLADLAEAYSKLAGVVRERREGENDRFAKALVEWTAAGSTPRQVLAIESVLSRVVAPLAAEGPVLLLVMDGMSFAVFRELLEDLEQHQGWVQLSSDAIPAGCPVVATIPSVTECSRTSLLCGRLARGGQGEAVTGFSAHPDLVAASKNMGHPLLFHKAELSEAAGHDLSAELRKAVASNRRVVGVVINAVDDYLLKGDQVQPRWTVEYIRALRPLLHEAAVANRMVVLASDHGHVIDRQTQGRAADGGERWREAASAPDPTEMLITGPRVLAGNGKLIALWSEQVHYGIKKNGYHGGLAPQEMLAPLAVIVPASGRRPAGWVEASASTPTWWYVQVEPEKAPVPTPVAEPQPQAAPVTLFDLPKTPPPIPAAEPVTGR